MATWHARLDDLLLWEVIPVNSLCQLSYYYHHGLLHSTSLRNDIILKTIGFNTIKIMTQCLDIPS